MHQLTVPGSTKTRQGLRQVNGEGYHSHHKQGEDSLGQNDIYLLLVTHACDENGYQVRKGQGVSARATQSPSLGTPTPEGQCTVSICPILWRHWLVLTHKHRLNLGPVPWVQPLEISLPKPHHKSWPTSMLATVDFRFILGFFFLRQNTMYIKNCDSNLPMYAY